MQKFCFIFYNSTQYEKKNSNANRWAEETQQQDNIRIDLLVSAAGNMKHVIKIALQKWIGT